MALTYSPTTGWTVTTVGTGKNACMVATQTVTPATSDTDAYTLKTPAQLDPTRPWTLGLSFSETIDTGQVVVIDLWVGYNDSFALSGQGGSVVATGLGANYKQIMDDAISAVGANMYVWQMDPNLAVADVVTLAAIAGGLKVKTPIAPYYAFNVDGASTFSAAAVCTWVIIQK